LVARAHRQQRGAALDCGVEAAVPAQPLGTEDLRAVLAAADQVDVAVTRHRVGGADVNRPGHDAPGPGPLLQDEDVALVAVRAEQVRVDPDN
jgi:hypothetical protein